VLALIGEEVVTEMDVEARCRRVVDVLRRERGLQAAIRLTAGAFIADEPVGVDERGTAGWRTVRPLMARGQLIGELEISGKATAHESAPAPLRPEFLQAITSRVAIALDNAALYERERDASHALQVGLLGNPLPTLSECELAGAYRPATESLEVGGDWYDAFWLPNGHLALVVGDVVGHGLDAAITMGHVRGAVRTIARFAKPAELLSHLDDFVATVPGAQSATVAYIEYDPDSGQMWYASAGHPPALLVSPGGHARYLWDGRSQPLGFGRGQPRTQASGMVGHEGVLLLYTDGLIERRTAALDVGLERLLAAVEDDWRKPPQDLTDLVLERMTGSDTTGDDVCMLAMRASPTRGGFYFGFTAALLDIARCRHGLREWLREQAVPRDDEQLILLAVGEAVSNAVEHGHAKQPGLVEVSASINADGEVFVSVTDSGHWIERPPTPGRGRGLHIMEATMDRIELDTSGIGTEIRLMRHLGVQRNAV
jgi:serine phosphatase RsbU (regulator of sigma subunit)/anti-sigma regulatory factor (Ser/Thr protein kinase)